MLRAEPNLATPNTLSDEPMRTKDLIDSELPIADESSTLKHDPRCPTPKTLKPEPKEAKLRNEIVDPKLTKSKTLRLLPNRIKP